MSYKPPFARMRAIKQAAPPVDPKRGVAPQPVSVDEALAAEPEAPVVEEAIVEEPIVEAPVVEEAAAVAPEPVEDEPEADEEPEATLPGAVDDTAPEPEAGGEDDAAEPSMDMKRSELDALAESLGVESPDKLPNKQAVIDAIHEAQESA
jgi:hypothetical protein